jgi:hypothetical protein
VVTRTYIFISALIPEGPAIHSSYVVASGSSSCFMLQSSPHEKELLYRCGEDKINTEALGCQYSGAGRVK